MIKMNNIKGTENSQIVLPTVIGSDYSEDESSVAEFRQIFLSTPESINIFDIWYLKQNDLDDVSGFLKKLKFFSW